MHYLRLYSQWPRIDAYLRPESFLGDLGVDENLMSDQFWHTLREACAEQGGESSEFRERWGFGTSGWCLRLVVCRCRG